MALGGGHREDVGQIQLALGVVGPQSRQPAAQRTDPGGDDAGIHLVDAALLRAGVAVLDDAEHAMVG